ncbi:MAG: DUF4236 domain-containing protein [Actinomycetota bacterium]|nr:DUF4236 domain-containing protein [Actinomycetota bacterium]
MGITWRKSKKLGPLRLTASKRGLGVSAGAGRARVGAHSSGRRSASFRLARGLRWFRSFSGKNR